MGRERLMQQQRARMMKRRARLKKQKADIKKYGSGGKSAVTRDTSKDAAKTPLVYTSKNRQRINEGKKPVGSVRPKPAGPAQPKPAEKKPAKTLVKTNRTKPLVSPKANTGTGRDGKFGTGTYGSGRPSDKPKKQDTRHKGGQRAKVRRPKRDLAAGARKVSERARKMNPNPSSIPMSPPRNPKEGDVYKKPFGPMMIYKNGKFVRK